MQFSQDWRWDLGYQHHDDLHADNTSVTVSTSLFESAVRYDWTVRNNLSLYGRLGVAYWDMEKTQSSLGVLNAKGFSPLGEMGVNYHFTPNLDLSWGYQFINAIGNSETGKYDSHGMLLGLTYNFNP
ncbi:Outer membrane protein A precursor [Vibrio thalassae]|uniref:Outer membrane protein A n=1 Tax=Vibrio thalassae TaxID=1243014 RepID=A0A240ERB2_9VIBR|nr:outer membrane beta-barrel protein [Vibrio thalassae]SNX51013.1 Outer membrane protein A precursor [Vibrio thalassae]